MISRPQRFLPLTRSDSPTDEAGVAEIVRGAAASKTPIYPFGGGTALGWGPRPTKPGLGLATVRLNRTIDYAPDDMTITVEAGLTIAELNRQLGVQRQRLPIDVPSPNQATIGGVLATNASGPRRYAYGTLRDYVLGVTAVDGQGEIFASGGRVVKNAAGYNVSRLLVGSLGTLGIITQVSLMVRPAPQASALVACDVPDLDMAECLLAGLTRTKTLPTAIEMLAGPAANTAPPGALSEGHALRLIVGFEGSRAEVEWMVAQLGQEWRAAGVRGAVAMTDTQANPLWNWLIEFRGDLEVAVLPSATADMIADLLELLPGCSLQAHAGNGIIQVRLPGRRPSHASPRSEGMQQSGGPRQTPAVPSCASGLAAMLRDTLRPAVAATNGHLVVLSSPDGAELTCHDVWGPLGDGAAVMGAIKDEFDPLGILNPGRFIFEA
jgi:glycolate oxidase FAD binding subunit